MGLLFFSRVPQILLNLQNKSTGQLSFFNFFLNFVGGAARLGTVLIETDDFLYQLQFGMGVLLNFIICVQFGIYWNNSGPKDAKTVPSKPSSGVKSSPTKGKREKIE